MPSLSAIFCEECLKPFQSQSALSQHQVSKGHERQSAMSRRCTLCSLTCNSLICYKEHVRGARHQKQLGGLKYAGPRYEKNPIIPGVKACKICQTTVMEKNWKQHIRGQRHMQKTKSVQLSSALKIAESNKNEVTIAETNVDFGILAYKQGAATIGSKSVKITNSGAGTVVLVEGCLSSKGVGSHFTIASQFYRRQLCRTSNTSITINFASCGENGHFHDRLELYFETFPGLKKFTITRPIVAVVGTANDHEILKASSPFKGSRKRVKMVINNIDEGVRPPALSDIVWANRLDQYLSSPELLSVAFSDADKVGQIVKNVKARFMPKSFDLSTYANYMKVLLWIEEEQASRELANYDMEKVGLLPQRNHYELRIDGLAEKRPSVMVGDKIIVRTSGSQEKSFSGYVHHVREKSVLLHFSPKFNGLKGQKFDVHFVLNRTVFRRMHQAVGFSPSSNRMLFPNIFPIRTAGPRLYASELRLFNRNVETNPPQLNAVLRVLNMPAGSVPFIVFGPPGTGKTVTIVEAIRQIIERNPGTRVLACAPSNSAADVIAERLADLGEKQLIRLIAPSRSRETVAKSSPSVLKFTRSNAAGIFTCPSCEELAQFKVIVSTCCNASVLHGIGMARGHFTHIFIDEAGQTTEPELMIPIKTLCNDLTNVILSGDVKQLGPIVRSAVARALGLSTSYLERLMSDPLHGEVGDDDRPVVKLTKNWRSHPAILRFPNDEFYRGELEPCAGPEITHSCARWQGLVRQDFPVIFHGVKGKDQREASSPSYFNIDEASVVRDYAKSLLEEKGLGLRPKNIGIIAPYHAQVVKIRKLLRETLKGTNIGGEDDATRVGSVEEYQGQERRVIIISTVRSSQDEVEFDLRHTLGFVANPRRFNVAVTRAQALLIVVGDPQVLSLDPLWRDFISYVHNSGGYRGKAIDWDPKEPANRLTRLDELRREQGLARLEELILRTSELNLSVEEDEEVQAFNRPWREDE